MTMEDSEAQKKWMGLVEIEDGQLLYSPLSKAIKTKYTCIAASSSHVILGANTGSLYCFTAKGFRYVRLLANVEGAVSLLKFSPDEKTLAVVVGGYNVCFWEINLHERNVESKRFHVSAILKGGVVTDMLWDGDTRLFYGDNQGRVVIAYVPKISRKFGSSSIFKRVDEIIHVEKSPIVQLDIHKDTLLVSSYQRCCLLKLTGEMIVASYTKVGTRPRDGAYGALFHPRVAGRPPVVFSARQGGRMWEADVAGTVLSTVRHKDSITMAPSNILSLSAPFLPSPLPLQTISNLNFSRLILIFNTYLLAWQKDGLFLFHPSSYSLCLWTNVLKGIVQVENVNEKLYVLHDNCQKITCMHFIGMTEVLQALVSADNPSLSSEFLLTYSGVIMADQSLTSKRGKQVVSSVVWSIRQAGLEMPSQLDNLLEQLLPKEEEHEEVKEKNGAAENGKERVQQEVEEVEEEEEEEAIVDVEETDGVELFVPLSPRHNEEDAKGPVLEQKVIDAIFKVEESVARSKEIADVLVTEEEGMFQMENGPSRENNTLLGSKSMVEPSGLTSSEGGFTSDHRIPPSRSFSSNSLTTPTVTQYTTASNGGSLPNSSEHSPLLMSGSKPGFSPTLPLSPPTSFISPSQVDQPPLSVRMGDKVNEENDDISEVGVVRSKKKRKGTKKKKKSSKPQQELDDIFENSVPTDISPAASQMSSTNPSEENSRASSPTPRVEAQNSAIAAVIEDPSMSIPAEFVEVKPNNNNPHPIQRSMSSDEPHQPKRQSIDIDLDLSRLGIQKPSAILSRVKSMASSQQEKTGRKVKELLSSLSPTPIATSLSPSSSPQTLPSFYSSTPVLASSVAPSDVSIMGVTSPSPEVGLLPLCGDEEESGYLPHNQLELQATLVPPVGNGGLSSLYPVTPAEPSPATDTETEKFVTSTNVAMATVDNPMTLSSPNQFRQALERWREELSTYHTHLSCLVSEDKSSSDGGADVFLLPPFTKMSSVVRKYVSELISLTVQGILSPDDLPEFIGLYKALLDISQTKRYIGTLPNELMKQCWSRLLCDERYLEGLVVAPPPSSSSSTTDRVVAVPGDSLSKIRGFIGKYPLAGPGLMQRVFDTDSSKFLELCSTLPDISPWEVAATTCLLRQNDSDSPASSNNEEEGLRVFGEYLNKVVFSETSTSDAGQSELDVLLKRNEEFLLLSIRACLATPPDQSLVGDNQRPLPHSHGVEWPHESGLAHMTCLSSMMSRNTMEQVISIFNSRGYWKGLVDLLIKLEMVKDLFSLVTDLRDLKLLKRITQNGLLNTADRWTLFLETLVSRDVLMTSNDLSHELSIERVIKAMVSKVGVEEACQVLSQIEGLQESELPCSLQQFLTSAAALHREKRSVAHVLLEKLDRHLWAARPPALGPQLLAVYKTKHIESPLTTSTLVTTPSSSEIHIEDATSHWGIRAESERCGVCRFPISSSVSDKEPGSLAFHCGHFYHRQCLPEQACILCFVKKYSAFFESK